MKEQVNMVNKEKKDTVSEEKGDWFEAQQIPVEQAFCVIKNNFPNSIYAYKATLSAVATLLLNDLSNPTGLVLVGNPSSEKTTVLDFFKSLEDFLTYHTDYFTPKALVSHYATKNEESREDLDMLPRIKNKVLLVPEMAPIFGKRREDLIDLLGILTRLFDGDGLQTDSGVAGRRGYTGQHLFVMLAATTPLPKSVWNIMGRFGARLVFLNINPPKKTPENVAESVMGAIPYKSKVSECKKATDDFVRGLWARYGGHYSMHWNRTLDDPRITKRIAEMAQLVAKARGNIQIWKEDIEGEQFNFKTPEIEEPERICTIFYNLARGHALINFREQLNDSDVDFLYKLAFSNMPYDRYMTIGLLLKEKELSVEKTKFELNCSESSAKAMMRTLEILGLVDTEEAPIGVGHPFKTVKLKQEFQWANEPEVQEALFNANKDTKITSDIWGSVNKDSKTAGDILVKPPINLNYDSKTDDYKCLKKSELAYITGKIPVLINNEIELGQTIQPTEKNYIRGEGVWIQNKEQQASG